MPWRQLEHRRHDGRGGSNRSSARVDGIIDFSAFSPLSPKRHDDLRSNFLCLGRPPITRRSTRRKRAHGARCGARVLSGQTRAARANGVSPRKHRSGDFSRNGRTRPARRDLADGIRRRGPELCQLRSDRARGRARRFGLSLDDERAKLAGHAADLRIRRRGAATEIPTQARARRMDRLFRPDRA